MRHFNKLIARSASNIKKIKDLKKDIYIEQEDPEALERREQAEREYLEEEEHLRWMEEQERAFIEEQYQHQREQEEEL